MCLFYGCVYHPYFAKLCNFVFLSTCSLQIFKFISFFCDSLIAKIMMLSFFFSILCSGINIFISSHNSALLTFPAHSIFSLHSAVTITFMYSMKIILHLLGRMKIFDITKS